MKTNQGVLVYALQYSYKLWTQNNSFSPNMWKVKVNVVQLCDPMDYAVHGILQARILERVAFPFSRGSSQPRIEPKFPALQAYYSPAEPQGKPILFQNNLLN